MKVKIKLDNGAKVPKKNFDDDFCYDVVAVSEEEIAPNIWKYGLGLAFEIERPYQSKLNLAIDFRPRSSVWETGMVLSNCEGTIDEGFRGFTSAVFYKVIPDGVPYVKNGEQKKITRYHVGDRIGQIKIGCCTPIEFEVVDELSPSERGKRSYGSSGK